MITKTKLTHYDFKPGFRFVSPGMSKFEYEVLNINKGEAKLKRLDGTIIFCNITRLMDLLNN